MTKPRMVLLAVVLAGFAIAWIARGADNALNPVGGPALVNTCLITKDVNRLVQFYEPVLALKAKRSGEDYAEFQTSVGVLAIFSEDAQERYIPGSAEAAKNNSVVLEFRVASADQEYRRLYSPVKTWVKLPSTQPWGTRSTSIHPPSVNNQGVHCLFGRRQAIFISMRFSFAIPVAEIFMNTHGFPRFDFKKP